MNECQQTQLSAEVLEVAGKESAHDQAVQIRTVQWVEYHPATGRIGQWVGGRGVVIPQPSEELALLLGSEQISTHTHHVKEREVCERPPSTIAMQQLRGVAFLSGVRPGTIIHVSGAAAAEIEQDSADGVVHLNFPTPGTYHLRAEQFPERQFEADITV